MLKHANEGGGGRREGKPSDRSIASSSHSPDDVGLRIRRAAADGGVVMRGRHRRLGGHRQAAARHTRRRRAAAAGRRLVALA